jgi:hypothetical protein
MSSAVYISAKKGKAFIFYLFNQFNPTIIMKQFLAIFGILLLGALIGSVMAKPTLTYPQEEYQVVVLDNNEVILKDSHRHEIVTTSMDSLAYYINEDNF